MKFRSMVRTFVAAWMGLAAASAGSAEPPVRTPSDQMKEAVNKLGKAPAAIGKSLQDLTESARDSLRSTLGGKTHADPKAEPVELNLPQKKPQPRVTPVDTRKEAIRDPFRPMTLQTKVEHTQKRESLSPLERLELSQLTLVGIVWDIKEPRAMVEDNTGLGYIIKVGTPIGSNDGTVKQIHRNQIVIEEFYSDPAGARKKRDVPKKLVADQ